MGLGELPGVSSTVGPTASLPTGPSWSATASLRRAWRPFAGPRPEAWSDSAIWPERISRARRGRLRRRRGGGGLRLDARSERSSDMLEAFRWTSGGGMVGLGTSQVKLRQHRPRRFCRRLGRGRERRFRRLLRRRGLPLDRRWRRGGPRRSAGTNPLQLLATGVSADGAVVVGWGTGPSQRRGHPLDLGNGDGGARGSSGRRFRGATPSAFPQTARSSWVGPVGLGHTKSSAGPRAVGW